MGRCSNHPGKTNKTNRSFSDVIRSYGPSRFIITGPATWLSLLRQFRSCLTTDPQDKIFGLYGIVQEDETNGALKPDYSLHVADLYIGTATYLLSAAKSFDIIYESIAGATSHISSLGLPSWVPDWSYNPATIPLYRISDFKTSRRGLDAKIENGVLRTGAVVLGQVRDTGIAFGGAAMESDDILMVTLGGLEFFARHERPATDFWETLFLGREQGWGKFPQVFQRLLEAQIPTLTTSLDNHLAPQDNPMIDAEDDSETGSFFDHCKTNLASRRFIAGEGFIGVGSGYIAPEDFVVIPSGCSTPIIVRQGLHQTRFTLVGDAYIVRRINAGTGGTWGRGRGGGGKGGKGRGAGGAGLRTQTIEIV